MIGTNTIMKRIYRLILPRMIVFLCLGQSIDSYSAESFTEQGMILPACKGGVAAGRGGNEFSTLKLPVVAGSFTVNGQRLTVNKGFSLCENPFRYSAYYHDSESGLDYLNARYYSPKTGVFTSRDTYDLSNRFAYGDADPVNNIDPEGHDAGSIVGYVMGGVMTAAWIGCAAVGSREQGLFKMAEHIEGRASSSGISLEGDVAGAADGVDGSGGRASPVGFESGSGSRTPTRSSSPAAGAEASPAAQVECTSSVRTPTSKQLTFVQSYLSATTKEAAIVEQVSVVRKRISKIQAQFRALYDQERELMTSSRSPEYDTGMLHACHEQQNNAGIVLRKANAELRSLRQKLKAISVQKMEIRGQFRSKFDEVIDPYLPASS